MSKEIPFRRLILIRHAHRDTSLKELDNGLSPKGWEQAEELAKEWSRSFPKQKPVLLSSPKARCIETLEPISKLTGIQTKSDPLLDEQEAEEKFGVFESRIEAWVEEKKSSKEPLIVGCSHGDWLPVALRLLTGVETEMKKGAWAEISFSGKRAKLERLLQKI